MLRGFCPSWDGLAHPIQFGYRASKKGGARWSTPAVLAVPPSRSRPKCLRLEDITLTIFGNVKLRLTLLSMSCTTFSQLSRTPPTSLRSHPFSSIREALFPYFALLGIHGGKVFLRAPLDVREQMDTDGRYHFGLVR